ncbi:MAG: hypothetical protein HC819_10325 [Cyclobacteriaceae bacterium]|nr:hypothetical protein [Cyclobacteriaceae bacterium]
MTNQTNIDQHKKILGVLYIVFGSLNLVGLLLISLIISTVVPFHVHDFDAILAIRIVKYIVITFTVVITAPAIVAGIGLMYNKDWALTLAFVIGIIGLLGFPVWTFIGIYSIVIFILAQNKQKPRQASDLISGQ